MQKRTRPVALALLWTLALGWAAVMFVFSGQDGAQSGELSMKITRFILRMLPRLPVELDMLHFYVRKTAHFGIFAVEGALLCAAMIFTLRRIRRSAVVSAFICACVAALNEYHQSFMVGRSCEVRDMIIDTCGAIAGIAFAALLAWRIARRRNVIIS